VTKHKHPSSRQPNPCPGAIDVRHPYWQRAHRDWRFLAVVFLMLAAMATYVMTGSLSWRNNGEPLPLIDAGK